MEPKSIPVIFIHGLWLHADSWKDWLDLFRRAGYHAMAPSWPGTPLSVEEARAHPETMVGMGVEDVTDHYALVIRTLDTKPIVIGHSFGGLIAQRLLGMGLVSAAVAIDPAPIKGVRRMPLSHLRVASIAIKNPANKWRKAVALTRGQFRYGFGNAITREESDELYSRWSIPSSGRPLFEAAFANLSPKAATRVDTLNSARGPLLLVSGDQDRTIPPSMVRSTQRQYIHTPAITDLMTLPGRGHSLVIDHGWREVAENVLSWLESQPLPKSD